jgi:uncharacterized cupredoxin-like copper-binding protein
MADQIPAPGHLAAETLGGYIDRSLPAPERASVDAHLADCALCRAELVVAKRLVRSAPAAKWARSSTVGIAAIAATILVAVLLRSGSDDGDRLRSERQQSALAPNVLTAIEPSSVSVAAASPLRFVWNGGPNVMEYTLTVMDADGRTRWSVDTPDTTAILPDSVRLAPGSIVYWYVDGLRADGGVMGTGRQRLTVQ